MICFNGDWDKDDGIREIESLDDMFDGLLLWIRESVQGNEYQVNRKLFEEVKTINSATIMMGMVL